MVKLKLGAIKWWSQPESKAPVWNAGVAQPTPQQDSTKAPVISPIQNKNSSTIAVPSPNQEPTESIKTNKLSLSGIKTPKKVEKKVVAEAKIELEVFPIWASCDLKNIELFPAYTSKFKKKQGSLLQEIKKLKRLPKTNKLFLLILIGSTIAWVAILFVLAPEKHNMQYYKTSLIERYEKMTAPKPPELPPVIDQISNELVTKNTSTGTINIDDDEINFEDIQDDDGNIIDGQKDSQYYQEVKKQILGEQFSVDESEIITNSPPIETEVSEDSELMIQEDQIGQSVVWEDKNILKVEWQNSFPIEENIIIDDSNNIDEFEDNSQEWPDDFLD